MTNSTLSQLTLDIQAARRIVPFSLQLMTSLLCGGPTATEKRKKTRALLEKEPLLDKSMLNFMSREDQLHWALRLNKRVIELTAEYNWTRDDIIRVYHFIDVLTPLSLHYSAFIPVIEAQGTKEQAKKWVTASTKYAILGCYAQTELSHGSNVLGLATTATFDETTDEFVIHTPSLTAAKWWIGGMGIVSTHAVVQAQLIVSNQSYGPHLFVVPIRSPVDHSVLKGVTVGDIGPKAYGGFAAMDNGYACFNHVRIPRDNMLMRFAKLSRNGTYTPPVHGKLSYGSMVKLRVDIVTDAGWKIAKASTIAIRYCTVRRQFHNPPVGKRAKEDDNLEAQVITYSSVQHRLMPLLALAYCLILTGQSVSQLFHQMTAQLLENDTHMLAEMHAMTCALKSWGSRLSSEGLEECRKAMGGHGYSAYSGVSDLFANFVPANTYEGDNYVLAQQVGRFLLKQLQNILEGNDISPSASYLLSLKSDEMETSPVRLDTDDSILDPKIQIHLFGLRTARLVADLGLQLQSGRQWSDLNMECWQISLAHAEYIVMSHMASKTEQLGRSSDHSSLVSTLKTLSDLFCLSTLCQTSQASFLVTTALLPTDMLKIRSKYRNVLASVASIAIPLSDAFDFTDQELNSALGRHDGNAYAAMWESVQTNPINSDENKKRYEAVIKDILHQGDNLAFMKASKL